MWNWKTISEEAQGDSSQAICGRFSIKTGEEIFAGIQGRSTNEDLRDVTIGEHLDEFLKESLENFFEKSLQGFRKNS